MWGGAIQLLLADPRPEVDVGHVVEGHPYATEVSSWPSAAVRVIERHLMKTPVAVRAPDRVGRPPRSRALTNPSHVTSRSPSIGQPKGITRRLSTRSPLSRPGLASDALQNLRVRPFTDRRRRQTDHEEPRDQQRRHTCPRTYRGSSCRLASLA